MAKLRALAFGAALSALALIGPASAQSAPQVAITIYNNGQALVEDQRAMAMSQGRQRLEFPGVSAQIRPETVAIVADDITIIEQNFDFDLLTPSKMMEKAVGSRVKIVRTNPATGAQTTEVAEVLAANEGVVLRIGDRIEVLRDDGLPVRVLFDSIPPNLRAKPTLSVAVDSTRASTRPVSLRYLTGGIGWSADYVGVFDERAGRLDMQGWVTLTNQSGTAYTNARTQLIAGSPGGGQAPIRPVRRGGRGGPVSDQTSFSDYHLYTLPLPTTIAENQTKQVAFLSANEARAEKRYEMSRGGFGSEENPSGAAVRLKLTNSQEAGLGAPLPAGTVRLYMKDSSGRSQFIGEDNLGHTPEGSDIRLNVGTAFDVTGQATMLRRETPTAKSTLTEMEYLFRNARNEAVTIHFTQSGLSGEHEFQRQSAPGRRVNANTYEWAIPVPARGEAKLSFLVRETQ
jgi:hypothetical protein